MLSTSSLRTNTTTTTTITSEEGNVSTGLIRVAASGTLARVSDQVLGGVFLITGAFLVYLVLFDQGTVASVIFGATAGRENLLHEFFHDGRHLWNAPCH
jgi:hypothetical protein